MNGYQEQPEGSSEELLLQNYREKLTTYIQKGGIDAYNALAKALEELQKRNPGVNLKEYKLYHLAILSTPPDHVTEVDFAGGKIQETLDSTLGLKEEGGS